MILNNTKFELFTLYCQIILIRIILTSTNLFIATLFKCCIEYEDEKQINTTETHFYLSSCYHDIIHENISILCRST